jgi:hypothetical protein
MQPSKRRQILEAIAASADSSMSDRLRAVELLDRAETVDRDFYADLEKLTPAELDRELVALGAPVVVADDVLSTPHAQTIIKREAHALAMTWSDGLRRQVVELRAKLADAESALARVARIDEHPRHPDAVEAARGAEKGPETPPRPLKVPDGIDVSAGWEQPQRTGERISMLGESRRRRQRTV